jgi:hypothetical protein
MVKAIKGQQQSVKGSKAFVKGGQQVDSFSFAAAVSIGVVRGVARVPFINKSNTARYTLGNY